MRAVMRLLLLVGLVLLGRSAYLQAKGWLAGELLAQAWEKSKRTGQSVAPWSWADTHPVGRLIIPAVDYNEVIVDGASGRNLAFGPARMEHGAVLGGKGNVVVAGHRTSWFLPLKDVVVGNAILVETVDARGQPFTRRFVVQSIHVIAPEDTRFIAPTSESRLTLITCYPFGPQPDSPQRYVVVALPEEPGALRS